VSGNRKTLLADIRQLVAHVTNGRRADAMLAYEAVARQAGDDDVVQAELGHACLMLGDPSQAIVHYERALGSAPDNAHYLGFLAVACENAGLPKRSDELFEQAYAINADIPDVNHGLGINRMRRGDYAGAREYLERACELKPSDARIRTNLATVLSNLEDYDLASKHAQKAMKLEPGHESAYYAYGRVLTETGRNDEAIRHFEKTIRQHKTFGAAYDLLARVKKFSSADSKFIEKAEKMLDAGMPAQDRYCLHYALGKIYDDLASYEQAFEHFRQANVLKKRDYDAKRDRSLSKQYSKVFDSDSLTQFESLGNSSATPVFIVGMPRTGTTLMEQMIASHPQAAGAGELAEMPFIAREISPLDDMRQVATHMRRNLTGEAIAQFSEQYLSVLTQGREGAERVVDKLPGNFINIGLILALFPNATIVHATRHPLDTCLSCYFQNFVDIRWANDFAVIGEVFAIYRETMDYWTSVFPEGRIVDVSYEQLVEDPRGQGRRLIESAGLEWDDSILEFHKGDRVIKTASIWQARQKIYKSSRQRWMNYAPYIGELANALSRYLQDERNVLAEHGIELSAPSALGRLSRLFG
jgi:tetratricopeptide (TPR) repeat protein